MNFLVETKKEYTIQLTNILTPLIYEGIKSIYNQAKKISDTDNVLKNFQTFLRNVPNWDQGIINGEYDRIMSSSRSFEWLTDLIRATLKSNIILLSTSPFSNTPSKIDNELYNNIDTKEFIHKIYIECARELWNNPYLFYHNYPAIDLKRNQRDAHNLIKECIEEAIRKILPLKYVLEKYLGDDVQTIQTIQAPNQVPNFDKTMTDIEKKYVSSMVNQDLNKNFIKNEELINNNMVGGNNEKKDSNSIGSRIISILDKKNINLSDSGNKKVSDTSVLVTNIKNSKNKSVDNDSSLYSKKTHHNSINVSNNRIKEGTSVENKIKNILEKDLGETDLETSLTYRQEENTENYREIFSNGSGSHNGETNVHNTVEKATIKNQRKFFQNYMKFN